MTSREPRCRLPEREALAARRRIRLHFRTTRECRRAPPPSSAGLPGRTERRLSNHFVIRFHCQEASCPRRGTILKTQIIAILLMGQRPEPYLAAVLTSLEAAVDLLVVNDNGGAPDSINRRVLEGSELYRRGQVRIVEAPFEGFSKARNLCLEHIRSEGLCDADAHTWLMMVDCDEVHGKDLSRLTRVVLPSLPQGVGVVDGYFVQFMQSFDYFISLDRRHNLLVRFNDNVRWIHDVHEQVQGLEGRRLCLPYVYYHYGYVMSNQQILEKWQLYQKLGDPSYTPEELQGVETARMFEHEISRCIRFTWAHPPALRVMREELARVPDPASEFFNHQAAARLSQFVPHLTASLRRANYRLRVVWRAIQAVFSGMGLRAIPSVLAMAF